MGERHTVNDLLTESRSRIERLDPAATRAALASGALVIDTRCAEQRRETGVIPGSMHVPLSVLFWRLDPASGYDDPRLNDLGRQVILVCADGYSSSLAAAILRDLGFARAGDLDGGFSAWRAAGLPVDVLEA
jgi:rhodanese-related sulfurtransferase